MTKILSFKFRWPVTQVADKEIQVKIPLGNGPHALNIEFIKAHNLSDVEQETCNDLVLESIAIIK